MLVGLEELAILLSISSAFAGKIREFDIKTIERLGWTIPMAADFWSTR
jgi:hypothetical protein